MNVINNMNKYDSLLSKYACSNKDAIRLVSEEKDIRPPFFRDVDRIIYSLSYTRYLDKTQVFSNQENTLICKRMVHVQLVSKIGRTIGRALNLNEDLIEAIALGHDLGHPPYGHVGESILNIICLENNLGYYNHNVQSVRILKDIEKNGNGFNLCVQVLDGIMCHNGEMPQEFYKPVEKTVEQFLNEYEKCYYDIDVIKHLTPMTLEGCVVRIADIIAYLGRDIEDAIRLNVIDRSVIPINIQKLLGKNNKELINNIILDIIKNSIDKPYIKISKEIYQAIFDLKDFNYKNIYLKANTQKQIDKYELMFRNLYKKYLNDLDIKNTKSEIFDVYLNKMDEKYMNQDKKRIVIDFISGMTDDYFNRLYGKYFVCEK